MQVCTFIAAFPFDFLDNFSTSDGKNVSSSMNSAKNDE